MPVANLYANYDAEPSGSVTYNRLFALPPIGDLEAYQIYYLLASFSSQSQSSAELVTNRIERCQLLLGWDAAYATGDPVSFISDMRDAEWVDTTSGHRFFRSGVWPQEVWRIEPFRTREIKIRARVNKALASNLVRITCRMYYEVVKITQQQAMLLDTTGVWIE